MKIDGYQVLLYELNARTGTARLQAALAVKEYDRLVEQPGARERLEKERPAFVAARDQAVAELMGWRPIYARKPPATRIDPEGRRDRRATVGIGEASHIGFKRTLVGADVSHAGKNANARRTPGGMRACWERLAQSAETGTDDGGCAPS